MKRWISLTVSALLLFSSGCQSTPKSDDTSLAESSGGQESCSGTPDSSYTFVESTAGFDPDGPVSPDFTDAEKKEQRENALTISRGLAKAAKEGKTEYVIPPGDYRFSNNTGYTISNMENMHILASGATFWFERSEAALLEDPKGLNLENCTNVTLEGLIVDFDPPLFLQGRVDNFNESANTIDITVDEGFPIPSNFTGQMLLYKADGTIMPQAVLSHSGIEQTGERTVRVSASSRDFSAGNRTEGLQEAFGDRVVLQKGDYVALPYRRGRAVYVGNCTKTTLKNVYIYASPGMGILEGFGDGNIYDGVRIKRRPGSKRLLACMADTFHSYSDITGPTIRNCEFSYNCDDFVNIHGFFGIVAEKLADNRYVIGTMKGEPLTAGGKLDFYDCRSIEDQGSATITEAARAEEYDQKLLEAVRLMKTHEHGEMTAYVVTLDKNVDASQTTLVDINSYHASGFLIENNLFHSSMGRAVLLSGAHDGVVQNNTFRSLDGGINISMESHFSMEGQFPENIQILNNRFEDILGYASVPPQDQPVQGFLYVGMVPAYNYLRNVVRNSNIVISGNYIENPPVTPILVAYTDGVTVTDNQIKNPYYIADKIGRQPGQNYYTENPDSLVYVTTSKNVTVHSNTAEDPAGAAAGGELKHKNCENVSTD